MSGEFPLQSHDPQPWVGPNGSRAAHAHNFSDVPTYNPRPEYLTRDPAPWRNRYDGSRWATPGIDLGATQPGAGVLDWSPRTEEYDD